MKNKGKSFLAPLLLVLAAAIWGTAFVAQRNGMDYIGPFTFNGTRSIMGGVVLLPLILAFSASRRKRGEPAPGTRRDQLLAGILCGLALFVASSLQQVGIQDTDAGKAGFITALYIVIVPVLALFLRRRTGWRVWPPVVLALVGLYLLTIRQGFSVTTGDLYLVGCALVFSLHIMLVDHFAPRVDGLLLSATQFFVSGTLSLIVAFLFERPELPGVCAAWLPLLYTGVLSCGVAYTLQIFGQRGTPPAVASLLMSLESVFAVLAGAVVLGERMSLREGVGCVLMFAAIVLSQLPQNLLKIRSAKGEKSR